MSKDGAKYNPSVQNIKRRSLITIALGSAAILLGVIVENIDVSHLQQIIASLINVSSGVLITGGGILLAIGIGAICVDFFSYVDYAKKILESVVVEKRFLDTIDDNEKKEMIKKLEDSIYYKSGHEEKNSLFYRIRSIILPYIDECYCKQYRMHIDCTVHEMYIEKIITRMFEIISPDYEKTFSLPFSTDCEAIDGIENSELLKIVRFTYSDADGKDIKDFTDDVRKEIEITRRDDGKVSFEYLHKLELKKGANHIKVITKTIVPHYDTIYSHRIMIPCERYSVNFSLCSDGYKVDGVGYSLEEARYSIGGGNRNVKVEKYANCCKVVFQNWVLPGEGCVFAIRDNSQNSN